MTPYRGLPRNASLVLVLVACRAGEPAQAPTETVTVPPAPSGSVALPAPPPDPSPPAYEVRSEPASLDDLMNGPTGPPGMAPFDRQAAVVALSQVHPEQCKAGYGMTGAGHVTITFAPDGHVTTAMLDTGPFVGTRQGACIETRYRAVTVPPFAGAPVRIGKSFAIN